MMNYARDRIKHNSRVGYINVFAAILLLALIGCILLIYQFPDRDRAKSNFLIKECSNFTVAIKLAENDILHGKKQIVLGGLRDQSDRMFLLDSILLADFGIEVYRAGCEGPTEEVDRYNEVMMAHFTKIYGNHFFERALNKVQRIIERRRNKARHT